MSLAQERHCTQLLPGMYEFTLAYSPNRWTHSAQRRDSCPAVTGRQTRAHGHLIGRSNIGQIDAGRRRRFRFVRPLLIDPKSVLGTPPTLF